MEGLRELFLKSLTEDTDPEKATAIFNVNGTALYKEVRLDMVMKAFDEAVKDLDV